MSAESTEIEVRNQTKLVLKHLQHGEMEKAQQIIFNHKEVLRYNLGLANFVPLIPRIRFSRIIPKNQNALKMVIDTGFQIYSKENDVHELLFFAAAKCDVETLSHCVNKILEENPENINQTREGDTALLFLIKYGNLADENCPKCIKILIDAGIDVNRNDYFSHNPILFLANLYSRYSKKDQKGIVVRNLKKCIELLLETKMVDLTVSTTDNTTAKDVLQDLQFDSLQSCEKDNVNVEEQDADKLFKLLIAGDEEGFKTSEVLLQNLDADDGNNTLLQLCCEKNSKTAAKTLIEKGADVCKTTARNPKIPLEIAARRNNKEIFDMILGTDKVIIDENLFVTFLRNRPKHIKARYFDEILRYKHLDVNIKSNNGNTPLHYAIIFSSTEAVGLLLQRGASLTVPNDAKKCPLDYISAEDLEVHLDKCIRPDNYTEKDSSKYEVALDYRTLIETNDSELTTVQKICNSAKLCHLLNHPLIASFIEIKWKLVEPLYQKLFCFQLLFYLIGILSFINLDLLNYLGKFLSFVYGLRIILILNWKNNKLHEIVDIVIAVLILLSAMVADNTMKYHLGVIVTIFMAFSFHLFWRFSPKFSEFHAILINITSHIFSYLLYAFILTLFLGAAFYIFFLVQYDELILDNDELHAKIFGEVKFMLSHFYLLFAAGVFISIMIILTIINSFVYLQDNFSENIKNNFKISGIKNILIFLDSVEKLYAHWKIIGSPFVFTENFYDKAQLKDGDIDKKKQKKDKNKGKFRINFFVNTNKFSFEKLLSVKLDEANVNKIKKVISR